MDEIIQVAALLERVNALKESLVVAKAETERRLDEMNELREQIHSERGQFLTIRDFDVKHEVLRRDISEIKEWISNMNGRLWAFGTILGGFVILINFLFRLWK